MSCERQKGWTYIICYLAHQSGGKLKENLLHINNLPTIDCFVQKLFGIVKDWWQRFIKEPFEYMLDILWVADDDSRWQRRDTDLEGRETGLMVGTNEPIKEFVSWLEEP
ncbi:MAG: hypothetical protein Q9188_005821 [Gyalolechia gomerana]